MRKITPVLYILILVALFGTVSCTRAAYKAPVTSVQPTPTLPFPVATQPNVMEDIISGTSTALAVMGTIYPTKEIGISSATPGSALESPAPTNTAQPMVEVPTATPGLPDTYTLHKGESVYCLSRRFDLNPIDLLSLNGLTGYEALPVGYILKIPSSSKWNLDAERSLLKHPTKYTVVSGDTIFSIACTYGDVDPNAIIFANSLSKPYDLSPGQVLQIP